jgi:hypothetical protein
VILFYSLHGGKGRVWKFYDYGHGMEGYVLYPSESYMLVPGTYQQMMEEHE